MSDLGSASCSDNFVVGSRMEFRQKWRIQQEFWLTTARSRRRMPIPSWSTFTALRDRARPPVAGQYWVPKFTFIFLNCAYETYRVTLLNGKTYCWLGFGMFRRPAWAVGNYSSSPVAARTVGTKSTGGFSVQNGHPVQSRLLFHRWELGAYSCTLCGRKRGEMQQLFRYVCPLINMIELVSFVEPRCSLSWGTWPL